MKRALPEPGHNDYAWSLAGYLRAYPIKLEDEEIMKRVCFAPPAKERLWHAPRPAAIGSREQTHRSLNKRNRSLATAAMAERDLP
jgi:hypothetical protein